MSDRVLSLPALAFCELRHSLGIGSAGNFEALRKLDPSTVVLPSRTALFVTWMKRRDLRGCIGTFAPQPLESGIREYSNIAAFEDTRFLPIRESEFSKLSVDITILGQRVPCDHAMDWVLGKHGIVANFSGGKSATFLPEVPVEQGWNKEETLWHLALKAGAKNPNGAVVERYPGAKYSMTYSEFTDLVGES